MATELIVAQIGLPTLMVLAGVLLYRKDVNRLIAKIDAVEASLTRITRLENRN